MKPNERSSLREFNKSPFIKFPIKENISTTAHKILLMIQVQLGGVDLPTDKDFWVIRRQFNMEKGIIFERIQRLIRCIVDCKAYDCDAVATRHALDLARSLSAEFWENSNLQLRQVPQVGPAAVRRLVTSDINSVETLASLDTATIERIMGKNPPFGRKTLDILARFPRLTVSSEIMGNPIIKAGRKPKVNVKVRLGFLNAKIPVWNSSRPSLTFMAETSDGKLVHFWRGNISKVDKGFDLKFFVELANPDDTINCHISCDEIVGTLRSCKLDPKVSASAFPAPKPKRATLQRSTGEKKIRSGDADEFGTEDIEDDELLAAVEEVEAPKSDICLDEFADIDDFDDVPAKVSWKKVTIEATDPVQMENGKWTCNHHCRGGKILKTGQTCKHICCKEGLDKRPGLRRIRANVSDGVVFSSILILTEYIAFHWYW
jgi:ATP-dependent DNA helicase HFM1/MER3